MPICVRSEIGPLKRVLLQRPGRELEHLSPNTMEELLFDDIPYLHGAQREHDHFAAVLRENGVEVSYLDELTAQTLSAAPELRERFIDDVIACAGDTAQGYRDALHEYLSDIDDPLTLVRRTMEGVRCDEVRPAAGALTRRIRPGERFLMPPIPNLYFTRDPFACVGHGVSLNHMFSATRRRETVYGGYVLRHHPDFAGQVPLYYTPDDVFPIEGGDVLNLSAETLAVGVSQRTQPEAVELLAQRIFADEQARIRRVLVLEIPRSRAFMHLDTVLTQVDRDKFTVHPGILGALRIFELTGRGMRALHVSELSGALNMVLADALGEEHVTLLRCGGGSEIAAAREQWNDGANTLCIAPGRVITYDRNYVTNRILEDNGVTVLRLPSGELSRGRGGPRCMSMPLERAALE